VDDDDAKAIRRGLADNLVGDKASWDKTLLAKQLEETGPLPGIDERGIEQLLDQLGPKPDAEEPVFPITPKFNEAYDYVVILATNETDTAWLHTSFDLRREASYKNTNVGLSRVMTVDRARQLLEGDGGPE
jgi:hypothetical protein